MDDFTGVLRGVWFLAGIIAMDYTIRKLRKAEADFAAREAMGTNGAELFAVRWRERAAWKSLGISSSILISSILSILQQFTENKQPYMIVVLIALTLIPIIFAWKQVDDDRSSDLLIALLRTNVNSPKRRIMDQEVKEGKRHA